MQAGPYVGHIDEASAPSAHFYFGLPGFSGGRT